MSIKGQDNLNIGAQNQQSGSDSLYVAFNKIQNNFTTLFSQASTYNTFVGSNGISTTSNSTSGIVTIVNSGVLNLNPGTGITLSGSNGNVTVSVSGNVTGALVAGVTNLGITSSSLTISNSPIVSAGNIGIDLPRQNAFAAGTYSAATVTVDQYGRVTNIANTISSGTVTSVAVSVLEGLAVTGGPITSSGTIQLKNIGVLSLTAGSGITLSGQRGDITISAGLDREVGTVTRVGIDSTTLTVSGDVTRDGNLTVNLPTNANFPGNVLVTASAVLGYGAGSGATVTQTASKTTGVTLNTPTGQITMNNAYLAGGASVTFAVSNGIITNKDTVILSSPFINADYYRIECSKVSTGYFNIRVTNITGILYSEALTINFAIIKGSTT
jgi:hypothetical protein